MNGPFVYRLGRKIFILERGVRFSYGLPSHRAEFHRTPLFLCSGWGRHSIQKSDLKDLKDPKDFKDPKDPKDPKDSKDSKDPKDPKDSKDPKDPKDPKDFKDPKDSKDPKEVNDSKDYKDYKELKNFKEIRASKVSGAKKKWILAASCPGSCDESGKWVCVFF